MIIEQLMPSLSPTMEEGTIAAWRVQKGDKVTAGQVIAEIQTDKTVVEWETFDEGTIAEIIIGDGQLAKVNMVAALITTSADDDVSAALEAAKTTNDGLASGAAPAASPAVETPPPPAAPAAEEKGPAAAPFMVPAGPGTAPAKAPPAAPAAPAAKAGNARVSPVAARIAAANNIDLNQVRGTGPGGRIIKRDVEQAVASGGTAAAKPAGNPFLANADQPAYTDIATTPMRQVIGQRLLQSKTQIPHFYVSEKIDAGAMVALRSQLNAVEGVKVTFNDLVLKATALTLVRNPAVNATFDGTTIRRYSSADISVAVAIPDGLITPIVVGAEQLTISQVNAAVKRLAKKAIAGSLSPEEYQGGSFTISNLGMFGIEQFNAIVNPPQAGILAVGGIKDEAVVRDGELVAGKTMRVTLSCDHRVVDGADAAAFLRDLRELLENPAALML